MQRRIILTEDGSHSVFIPEWNVAYHSIHGAIQESQHIFIEAGLKQILQTRKNISVFEMGFGTGLNGLLTLIETNDLPVRINYETVEAFPIDPKDALEINYAEQLSETYPSINTQRVKEIFLQMHQSKWDELMSLTNSFNFLKISGDLQTTILTGKYDLIYFDAFDPAAQPELWTEHIFKTLYHAMNKGGLLLTYCSKGSVRRAMAAAGFEVKKIPGPKGKREVVRAMAR